MHFTHLATLLLPLAIAMPIVVPASQEITVFPRNIPDTVYDLDAWKAVLGDYHASKYFSQGYLTKDAAIFSIHLNSDC
jgi:hypothetical protein